MATPPEVWLRGPLPGILPQLQPAAHALLQVREDVAPVVAKLSDAQLWQRPGGAASIGFHLLHLAGSIDRLLTYARGEALSDAQRLALAAERTADADRPDRGRLLAGLSQAIDEALRYLATLTPEALLASREVGRQRLPSTTAGLIFHAAEHASRHAGQVVTLGAVVGSGGLGREGAIPILPGDDLAIARDFYVERLGFRVRFEATEDGTHGLLGLERGGIRLTIDCPMAGHGRDACVSLEVDSADRYYEEWKQRVVVRRPPRNEPWGARSFDLADPFGNTIFVMGPLAPDPP